MPRLVSLFSIEPLLPALEQGRLIITPNQRLASRICTAYAIAMRERGCRVVAQPRVYSLEVWVARDWQQLLLAAYAPLIGKTLLSQAQELALWEQVVSASAASAALLRPAATAASAQQAYQLLLEWGIDADDAQLQALSVGNDDCQLFLHWLADYRQRCQAQDWVSWSQRKQLLLQARRAAALAQEPLLAVGFDDASPLTAQLLAATGPLEHVAPAQPPAPVQVVACEQPDEELQAAAVWARRYLRQHPDASLAVVVPQLAQQRARVERIFQQVFDSDYLDAGSARRSLPFNCSAGQALLELPLIQVALHCLELSAGSLPLSACSTLLQSPFIALSDDDEALRTALLEALYSLRQETIRAAQLRHLAQQLSDDGDALPWEFARRLQAHAVYCRAELGRQRTLSQWGEVIAQLLVHLGWPGLRRLDSQEYQQLRRWQGCLQQLGQLDMLYPPQGFAQALSLLRSLLARDIFQAQTLDSPLQILGLLEAAGLEFDALWLTGMSERQWPPAAAANPLLPFALQGARQMPHCNAERELQFAEQLCQRFLRSTGQLLVSFPRRIDESDTQVSRLFAAYPQSEPSSLLAKPLSQLLPSMDRRRRHWGSRELVDVAPGDAPQLGEREQVRGGSALFASQAACPFRAFASHRLGLSALPAVDIGLSAADRGSLLHRALELIWRKLARREALLALDQAGQQRLLSEVIDYVLDAMARQQPVLQGARFRALEQQRLLQLLDQWLLLERERAEFSVAHVELRRSFRFAQLELQMRIDRIDRLADGGLLIIDYKSGQCAISRWWGERPDEPQLPLYSMLVAEGDQRVAGICYASVRLDECALKGVGEEQLSEPSLRWSDKHRADSGAQDWAQLQQQWTRVLTTLAQQFIAGQAAVDPKQGRLTCQYCELSSLCRIRYR